MMFRYEKMFVVPPIFMSYLVQEVAFGQMSGPSDTTLAGRLSRTTRERKIEVP